MSEWFTAGREIAGNLPRFLLLPYRHCLSHCWVRSSFIFTRSIIFNVHGTVESYNENILLLLPGVFPTQAQNDVSFASRSNTFCVRPNVIHLISVRFHINMKPTNALIIPRCCRYHVYHSILHISALFQTPNRKYLNKINTTLKCTAVNHVMRNYITN